MNAESYVVDYTYEHDTSAGTNTRSTFWNIAARTFKYGALNDRIWSRKSALTLTSAPLIVSPARWALPEPRQM